MAVILDIVDVPPGIRITHIKSDSSREIHLIVENNSIVDSYKKALHLCHFELKQTVYIISQDLDNYVRDHPENLAWSEKNLELENPWSWRDHEPAGDPAPNWSFPYLVEVKG